MASIKSPAELRAFLGAGNRDRVLTNDEIERVSSSSIFDAHGVLQGIDDAEPLLSKLSFRQLDELLSALDKHMIVGSEHAPRTFKDARWSSSDLQCLSHRGSTCG